MVQGQKFGTGTRYRLEILHQCGKRVKTKSQRKFWGTNSYFCRNYRGETDRGAFLPPFHNLNVVNTKWLPRGSS